MNNELLSEFIALYQSKDVLKSELERISDKIEFVQAMLMKEFTEVGVKNMRILDRTVYINRSIKVGAKDGNKAALINELKSNDQFKHLVAETYNTNQLRSQIKDYDENEVEYHLDNLNLIEEFTLRVRK